MFDFPINAPARRRSSLGKLSRERGRQCVYFVVHAFKGGTRVAFGGDVFFVYAVRGKSSAGAQVG